MTDRLSHMDDREDLDKVLTSLNNDARAEFNRKVDEIDTVFESTARRVETQIPSYFSIPPFILRRLAKVFTEGKIRYGDRNWTKGLPTSSTMNHLIEHLMLYAEGYDDEDHLAKALWGVMCLMYTEEFTPEMVDPKWTPAKKH